MTAGATATFTAAATGNPNPTVQWYDSTDNGATYTALSGATATTLTFTTAATDNGNLYEAVFTNSVGSATTTAAMLDVQTLPTAIVVAPATLPTGMEGTAYTTTFTATGGSGSGYTFTESGTLPAGLTFSTSTAQLIGTPTASGTFSNITITATDSSGEMGSAIYSLTINPGAAPVFTSPASTTLTTTVAGSFSVTVTGTPTLTVTESGTLPTGVTFNTTTDVLGGKPAPGTNGTYALTFIASNSSGSTSQTFTLTVNSPIDELGAYRASDGSWSLDSDGTPGFNSATDQVFFSFSPPNVTGVAGDWTGSGTSKIGYFDNGVWGLDLQGNGVLTPSDTFTFGQAGDQPVVGDWTGNGVTNIGVFRTAPDGVTGEFILDTNGDHILDAGDTTFTFGFATDRIVIGDWNGAGKDEVGVVRDASSFNPAEAGDALFSLDTNGDHAFGPGDQVFVFGLITDGVVIGDWNGAGKSEVGVYRDASTAPVGNPLHAPGTALFSLDTNGDHQFDAGDQVFLYGRSSDQFVSGHWAKTPPLQAEGTPQAQFAANGPGSGGSALTEAQLEPVLDQAITAWAAEGANVAQLEAAQVQIGTLDDNLIGETSGNQITLDATADGWGWNTDSSNTDFTSTGRGRLVQATPGSEARHWQDGFVGRSWSMNWDTNWGLPDVDPLSHPSDLMAATLAAGVRRRGDDADGGRSIRLDERPASIIIARGRWRPQYY